MDELYISTDIESDGPCPGINSMLSFGSAAFNKDSKLISTFEINLETLDGAVEDNDTMEFWSKNIDAWNYIRQNQVNPAIAIKQYCNWLATLRGHGIPVFVAYPLGFDFTYMYWYIYKFTGKKPFSFSGLDIKTFAMFMMNTEYRKSTKRNMPKRWFSKKPHTHKPLDDAIEQGELFFNMYKEYKEKYHGGEG